jgi:hypothetical protein
MDFVENPGRLLDFVEDHDGMGFGLQLPAEAGRVEVETRGDGGVQEVEVQCIRELGADEAGFAGLAGAKEEGGTRTNSMVK